MVAYEVYMDGIQRKYEVDTRQLVKQEARRRARRAVKKVHVV